MALSENRYALFADDDSSDGNQSPSNGAQNTNNGQGSRNGVTSQDGEEGAWYEVKRGQPKKALKTIVVRPDTLKENPAYVAGLPKKPKPDFPESTSPVTPPSPTNGDPKPYNLHENFCGVCSIKLPGKVALQHHMKQLPGHENYCNLCRRVFKDRNGLKNHLDNSKCHDIFCNLCLSAFKDKWGLRSHFENNLAVGHRFACLACLQGFQSIEKLKVHYHTAANHVCCETCHRRFRSQQERDEHWVTTKKHRHCLQTGCEFDAPNDAMLAKHLQEDHFQCDHCHSVFPSSTKLSAHVVTCAPLHHCGHCNEYFQTQDSFAAHQAACSSYSSAPHSTDQHQHVPTYGIADGKCWFCEKSIHSQSQLIGHLERGKCPQFVDPPHLYRFLGNWWYSVLYMDIDLHASVRTGRCSPNELAEWVKADNVPLFVCRAQGCDQTFTRLSGLVYHVETGDCDWDVKRLRLDMLKRELARYMAENGLKSA